MDNQARASPPGHVTSRKRLTTSVLSVEAYWQALRKLKGRSPKEILVPLWPGESLQQYEREFLRWLAVGRLSITELHEDPAAERKYRLQFAETRVNRPRSNSQGATFDSRWQSQSRSRSPKRFGNVQQQPHASSRQDRMKQFERRSSIDNGHISIARQSPDRSHHDRSSVQWHSQTDRYPDAHEPPRPYSNWQAPHGADLRRCQDPGAPPPRDVHHQFVNNTQRWNHSRSRSPRYRARAASPPRSDTSLSHVCRSSLPHDQVRSNVDNLRRQLLAKRVVSVEVFRDEMKKLQNGVIRQDDLKRPHEAMVRIPVILWPDEVMIVYAEKFERWLESRQLSLALVRDNPAEERALWYSFACMRAGTPELGEIGVRSRSRSQSHSSSQSIQRSSERGRSPVRATYAENNLGTSSNSESREHSFRRKYARSPDHHGESRSAGIQHPPSMVNPPQGPRLYNKKTRRQLLERRVLLLEDYQKEVDQSSEEIAANEDSLESLIPVPLYPRESMGHYDHRFWVWLRDYGETKETLRSNPLRERRFRMTFASLRLNKPQVLTTTGDLSIETQTALIPGPNSGPHTKIPVGILKTVRAHLVKIGKRPADTVKQQAQAMPDEPSYKRSRIDAEGMTQVQSNPGLSSSRSTVCPKQKRKPLLSLVSSNGTLPRSSSALTIASSTGASSTATTASTSSSAGPDRPSILPRTASEKRTALADVQTARSASILNQRKEKKMRAKKQVTASAKETKTATSSNAVATSTKTAAFRARGMATNAETARLNKGVALKRQAKVRNRRTPELEPLRIKADPAALRSSLPSVSLVTPESRAEPTPTTAATPIRAPLSANVSSATATITKKKRSINVAENDSADTDTAESEPDIARTESMAQEESDAESDPSDESEQHDGDVMNPDGCCCNKCMRSWAKTLTIRMDQLEQNVLDLKRQIIG